MAINHTLFNYSSDIHSSISSTHTLSTVLSTDPWPLPLNRSMATADEARHQGHHFLVVALGAQSHVNPGASSPTTSHTWATAAAAASTAPAPSSPSSPCRSPPTAACSLLLLLQTMTARRRPPTASSPKRPTPTALTTGPCPGEPRMGRAGAVRAPRACLPSWRASQPEAAVRSCASCARWCSRQRSTLRGTTASRSPCTGSSRPPCSASPTTTSAATATSSPPAPPTAPTPRSTCRA
ncbi:hypothetical protein BS78_05G042400 [Paspalum vaginatum]|nr:hypothetical protein BS78_05G042400 [Paspalum vaginatum]